MDQVQKTIEEIRKRRLQGDTTATVVHGDPTTATPVDDDDTDTDE